MVRPAVSTPIKGNQLYYYLILAIIAFAVYANSLSNQFVFDDESLILSDPTITLLSNIPLFFTGEMGFHKVIGAYFRPMVSTSFTVDYAIWGYDPFGFHLTNVLIHIICVLLLYRLLMMMFSGSHSNIKDHSILLVTALFAVHPIHTEVVSWVSGRTDGLACVFYLPAFIFYLRFAKSRRTNDLVFTGIFYSLSLLSKEMAITFPAVVLLYELIVNKRGIKKLIRSESAMYITLILISLIYIVYRSIVLSQITPRQSYIYFYGKDSATAFSTMLQTIPLYLRLMVLPYGLLYHYSGYLPDISSPLETGALIAIGVVAVLIFAAIWLRNRMPQLSFGLLYFLVTLLPVMNIIPTPNFMAERFLYIPSVFLSIVVCSILLKLANFNYSKYVLGAVFLASVVFGYMTIARNGDWKTNDALFLSAQGRQGVFTYINLGNVSARKGNMDEAELYFRKALDLRPETLIANNNLGKVFMVKGQYDSALFYMNKARLLDTLSPEPVSSIAELHEKSNMTSEAMVWLEKLNAMAPQYMNAKQRLDNIKAQMLARDTINKGSTQPKSDSTAHSSSDIYELERLSGISYNKKNYSEAIEQMKELIRINPSRSSVYYSNIGMCYMDQNRFFEAIGYFQSSINSDPKFSTAYNNLGYAFEMSGDKQKAKENYEKALQLDPGNQLAKQRLENIR